MGELGEKQGSVQHFGKSNRFDAPAPKAGALPAALHPDIKLLKLLEEGDITNVKKRNGPNAGYGARYVARVGV